VSSIRRRSAFASVVDVLIDRIARRAGLRADGPAMRALYASPRERKLDYLSFDYYDPIIGHFANLGTPQARKHRSIPIASELWEQLSIPDGLVVFLRQAHEQARGRPILVAENGMATPGRSERPDGLRRDVFIDDMCGALLRARDVEKLPVAGYLHWTLADNYEWGSYKPAFGLYGVDRSNGVRILETDAIGVDAAAAYRRIIAEDRRRT
jgi:beta-glucosidase/6-phospho-beta-glucosidase/beta-galactosidase